ncbi:hypothetical protein B0H11DRAFT_1912262 [Mycena galericulata]|nr:hypothetical protein B0H11DRAFT_1912262 [Mycena galericulata]
MSGIALLTIDLLGDIMLNASSIDEKFALCQVSKLWRAVALDTPLLWSSFTGGSSKADCYRVPLVLERSGPTTMLHIRLRFTGDNTDWSEDVLTALQPYVPRIQTLVIEFKIGVDVNQLLDSNLLFPALQILRLRNADRCRSVSLLAPQLRTLDLDRFFPRNWNALLGPRSENIRLHRTSANLGTLYYIFTQCPLVWRLVFDQYRPLSHDYLPDFRVLKRRPLGPALRELELRLWEGDELDRILRTAFCDVVLRVLTGSAYSYTVGSLANSLLCGVGPFVAYECNHIERIELRDDSGHVRRLECFNSQARLNICDVWEHLSLRYELDRTVRSIQITIWHLDHYIRGFERFPPQAEDGVTLTIKMAGNWETRDIEGDMTRTMRIPGLVKVEFRDVVRHISLLGLMLKVLAHIEPPAARKVEVCFGNVESEAVRDDESLRLSLFAVRTALAELPGNPWIVCNRYIVRRKKKGSIHQRPTYFGMNDEIPGLCEGREFSSPQHLRLRRWPHVRCRFKMWQPIIQNSISKDNNTGVVDLSQSAKHPHLVLFPPVICLRPEHENLEVCAIP